MLQQYQSKMSLYKLTLCACKLYITLSKLAAQVPNVQQHHLQHLHQLFALLFLLAEAFLDVV